MNNKVSSLLSLCKKAGFLVSGEYACEKALQNFNACLTIVATDASDNTKKKFINKSFYYEIPSIIYGDKDSLSTAIGKDNRAVVIITDEKFTKSINDAMNL